MNQGTAVLLLKANLADLIRAPRAAPHQRHVALITDGAFRRVNGYMRIVVCVRGAINNSAGDAQRVEWWGSATRGVLGRRHRKRWCV